MWEGVGDRTELQHIDPHSYDQNSVSFPFSLAAQPGAWCPASLGHCPHSSIFSPTNLRLWTPTAHYRVLGAPSARCWFSLQHLISNCLGLFTPTATAQSGSWGTPLLSAGSLYRILSPTDLNFLAPGLYNNLTSSPLPAGVTISHSIQPLDSQRHILIYTQMHFLFWHLGRVRGQYATFSLLRI